MCLHWKVRKIFWNSAVVYLTSHAMDAIPAKHFRGREMHWVAMEGEGKGFQPSLQQRHVMVRAASCLHLTSSRPNGPIY